MASKQAQAIEQTQREQAKLAELKEITRQLAELAAQVMRLEEKLDTALETLAAGGIPQNAKPRGK